MSNPFAHLPGLALAGLWLAACGPALAAAQGDAGFDPAELDPAVAPAEDFFAHVNGRWLAATPIPPEWSSYGVMQQLYERTEGQLRAIAEDAQAASPPADSDAQRLGDFYRSFMDEAQVAARGLEPLAAELARIDALDGLPALAAYFGHALRIGVQVPVNFYVDGDAAAPDRNLAYLWQDGLGLPDRDYYLQDSEALTEVRTRYREHVVRMHELAGWPDAEARAGVILALETRLARQQWSRVQNRDRERIYRSKYDLAGARTLAPALDWTAFLAAAGFGTPPRFVLAQADYFAALGGILADTPMADWRAYLRFKLLKAYAPYLTAPLVQEDFAFQRGVLRGQQQLRPRWKRGVALLNDTVGELLGREYVHRHFPPAAKAQVQALVERLRAAFRQSIDSLDWMTGATRAAALDKLARFSSKIGYPDQWQDYSSLEIRPDDLVGNVMRARTRLHDREAAKLGKPVDRSEWGMSPQTVNAYYRATLNEIVFPAAILQPPFFDVAADPAVNYGAIGAIIGHEFSHGFDDQGRKFDGRGRLHDWWTPADAAEYERRTAGLVAQFDAFRPLPDLAINGRLTLGENIADLAGVELALRAWRLSLGGEAAPVISGFTGEQRFFIGYARAWRSEYREPLLREMLLSDPHAPARYRVLGPLQNLDEFQAAFAVAPGDAMYLPPGQRVRIW